MYTKPAITNLRFSCKLCKHSTLRPGVDNLYCSSYCKQRHVEWVANCMLKKDRSKPERKKRQRNKRFKNAREKIHPLVGTTEFYDSKEWREVRYRVIKKYGRKCMVCFTSGIEIHVDHIVPISKCPEMALKESNLQVLCKPCNLGKGNRDMIDWRPNV